MYAIEFWGWWKAASFFEVFGKNPLFIYVMSGVLVKLYLLLAWWMDQKKVYIRV